MKISEMIRQGANSKEFWAQNKPWKLAMVASVDDAKVKDATKGLFQLSGEVSMGVGVNRYTQKFKNVPVQSLRGVGIQVGKSALKDPWSGVLRVALEQGGAEAWFEELKGQG